MDQSLGQKIDKKMRGTVWSRSEVAKRRAPRGIEKGQDRFTLRWFYDSGKDAKWLKMLICNLDQKMVDQSSFMNKWQSCIL